MILQGGLKRIPGKALYALMALLYLFSFKVNAQVTITGKVTDAGSKAPLYPATVFDQTTGNAVYADSLGNYRIIARSGDELIYSYLGFYGLPASAEIPCTGLCTNTNQLMRLPVTFPTWYSGPGSKYNTQIGLIAVRPKNSQNSMYFR